MKFRKHFVKLSNKTGILYAQTAYKSPGAGWDRYYPKSCSDVIVFEDIAVSALSDADTFTSLVLNFNGVILSYTLGTVIGVNGATAIDVFNHLKLLLNSIGTFSWETIDVAGTPTYRLRFIASCEFIQEAEVLGDTGIDSTNTTMVATVA